MCLFIEVFSKVLNEIDANDLEVRESESVWMSLKNIIEMMKTFAIRQESACFRLGISIIPSLSYKSFSNTRKRSPCRTHEFSFINNTKKQEYFNIWKLNELFLEKSFLISN